MNDLDTLCYIQEQTSFVEDYNGNFGYEEHQSRDKNKFYITFDAVLQSFDVLNRNRRKYDAQNVIQAINESEYVQDMLKHNTWLGEIDHPSTPIAGQELSPQRMYYPNMEKTSHYIRRPKLVGNLLEAKIQTDSGTVHGMNMATKIVDGKITPCFSARLMGSLQQRNGEPYVNVRKLVTYDWVLFPSHKEAAAKLSQPVLESTQMAEFDINAKIIPFIELARQAANDSKETEVLCEAFGLNIDDVIGVTESGNSLIITEDQNTYIQPITDKHIRNRTKNRLRDWLNN